MAAEKSLTDVTSQLQLVNTSIKSGLETSGTSTLKKHLGPGFTGVNDRLSKLVDYFNGKSGREEETRLDTAAVQEETVETLHDIDTSINNLEIGDKAKPKGGFWGMLGSIFAETGVLLAAAVAGLVSGIAVGFFETAIIGNLRKIKIPQWVSRIGNWITGLFAGVRDGFKNSKSWTTIAKDFFIGIRDGFKVMKDSIKNSKFGVAVKDFFIGVRDGFRIVKDFIKNSKFGVAVKDFFIGVRDGFRIVKDTIKNSKFGVAVKDLFTNIGNRFSAIKDSIKNSKLTTSSVKDIFTSIGNKFRAFKSGLGMPTGFTAAVKGSAWFTKISTMFTSIISKFSMFFKIGRTIGNVLGKLAWPLTIIMAIWDGITGAMKGYKTGGILGAIKGAFKGIVTGLVGWIWDLGMWLIKAILRLFGFDGLAKKLDGFSFSNLFDFVWSAFGMIFKLGKYLGKIFSKLAFPLTIIMGIWNAITGALEGYKTGGILGAIKGAFKAILVGLIGWIWDLGMWLIKAVLGLFGLDSLAKKLDGFSFSKIFDFLWQIPEKIIGWILAPIMWAYEQIKGLFSGDGSFITKLLKFLWNISPLGMIWNAFHWVYNKIKDVFFGEGEGGGIKGLLAFLWKWSPLGMIWRAFKWVYDKIAGLFSGGEGEGGGIKGLLAFLWKWSPLGMIWRAFSWIIDKITGLFSGGEGEGGGIKGFLAFLWKWHPINMLWRAFSWIIDKITGLFSGTGGDSIFKTLLDGLKSLPGIIWEAIKKIAFGFLGGAVGAVAKGIGAVVGAVGAVAGAVGSVVTGAVSAVGSAISDVAGGAYDAVSSVGGGIMNMFGFGKNAAEEEEELEEELSSYTEGEEVEPQSIPDTEEEPAFIKYLKGETSLNELIMPKGEGAQQKPLEALAPTEVKKEDVVNAEIIRNIPSVKPTRELSRYSDSSEVPRDEYRAAVIRQEEAKVKPGSIRSSSVQFEPEDAYDYIKPVQTNSSGAQIDQISKSNKEMQSAAMIIAAPASGGGNNSKSASQTTNVSNVSYQSNNIPDRTFFWASGMLGAR